MTSITDTTPAASLLVHREEPALKLVPGEPYELPYEVADRDVSFQYGQRREEQMGLDITAYSKLKHVGKHPKDPDLNEGESGGMDDWCYYDEHVQAFAYDSFPQSFRGVPVIGGGPDDDFLFGGCFAMTLETKTHAFCAGSYGGYSRWRENLQMQFNPERDPEKPFYELIWFADNEGIIGPDAAADLLADFKAHAETYVGSEYDRVKYDDWTKAFELAADGGLVRFH